MTEALTAAEVLDFFFGGPRDDVGVMTACLERWFNVDRKLDQLVEQRFGSMVSAAIDGAYGAWCDDSESVLALIILLDQFPRNAYRGKPRCYAGDARARTVASQAIARGLDAPHEVIPRILFYMPFEHAEDAILQERCVAGYESLHASAAPEFQELTQLCVQAGRDHREVIRRFGRFPHRNAILGRENTPAEAAWLEVNRGGWGQGAADLE